MSEPKQKTVFPVMTTLEEVVEQGASLLPITDRNELVALLGLYHNTLMSQMALNESINKYRDASH